MEALEVVAHIPGQIALPNSPLALDALLASQVAARNALPPPATADDCVAKEIPVQREPKGRFHLCSFSVGRLVEHDIRFINRRAPVERYQQYGVTGRVQIQGGPDKSYRIPLEVGFVEDARLTWWCIGDRAQVEDLLSGVLFLGKKRNVGLGKVERWSVEPCDTWPGFPVVRDGAPLRPLPLDWPGLVDPPQAFRTLTYPYWDHSKEVLAACPL